MPPATPPPQSSTPDPTDVALALAEAGFYVVPLCAPHPDGSCAFGMLHNRPKDCGKTPLLGKGWQRQASNHPDVVHSWWRRWPQANVGLVLEPSGIIVVDPDSDDAQVEAAHLGLDGGLARYSRQRAYLFRRPSNCPAVNITHWGRSGAIDLLAKGMVVVHGRHVQGFDVFVEAPIGGLAPTLEDFSDAPAWVVAELQSAERQRETKATPLPQTPADAADVRLAVSHLSRYGWGLWTGGLVVSQGRVVPKAQAKNGIDRSSTLFALGSALARRGASASTIAGALAERDIALGYHKFADRSGAREYARIGDMVVAATAQAPRPRSAPVVPGQWEWMR